MKAACILSTENYCRKDNFEIVNEFPDEYIVWNIGRHNFPFKGYIPLAKPINIPHSVDLQSLKAIKVNNDMADFILKKASRRRIDKDAFECILSSFIR